MTDADPAKIAAQAGTMAERAFSISRAIPHRAGASLKAEHYADVLETRPDIGWFEVHPENYMGAGGPPHHYLSRIRDLYPLSLHGVGLSIGGADALNDDHLARLKALVDRYDPGQFSEHLAWSSHNTCYHNDLLPLPYTEETLGVVCDHIDLVQETIGRRMLLENPSTYVVFDESTYEEIDFLRAIIQRTGCGLLLDVNNVYISCTNHKRDPRTYLAQFPVEAVGEIHLAGHDEEVDAEGERLLIDSHNRQVIDEVWELYRYTLSLAGAVPTLIEWDDDIPDWPILFSEARQAEEIMRAAPAPHRISTSREALDAVA